MDFPGSKTMKINLGLSHLNNDIFIIAAQMDLENESPKISNLKTVSKLKLLNESSLSRKKNVSLQEKKKLNTFKDGNANCVYNFI